MHRKTGMMTTRHPDAGFDEVIRVPERRPELFPDACTRHGNAPIAVLDDVPIAAFVGAFIGCLATEHFSAFGIVPGIASAFATALVCGLLLVTRTDCLFAGSFFSALYGGSFAGMTPITWLGGGEAGALSLALSLVCGLVYFVVASLDRRSAAPVGIECGGRLGTIAIVASFLFLELVGALGADTSRFRIVAAGAFDVQPWSVAGGLFACLVGILGTSFLLRLPRIMDTVPLRIFVASATALSGLIVLHFGSPDDAVAMDAFYAGCFLGMSAPHRLKGWLQPVSAAVVLIVLLVPARALLNGFGGSLGFAAFIAVMLLIAVSPPAAWLPRDLLTGSRSFAVAIASAGIAVLLMIGLLSAVPLVGDVLLSAASPASESTVELPDAASVRLAVGKPEPGAADNLIPIGISLSNAAAGDEVLLNRLPSGWTVTHDLASATGGRPRSATELTGAAVRPAPGLVGGADIAVELRHVQSVIDRQEPNFEWAGAGPRATTDIAPPLAAGQLPDVPTDDKEALFRAFLRYRGQATPETRGAPQRPRAADVRSAARSPHRRDQTAASGPHSPVLPIAAGTARPGQPMVRRAELNDRQNKPAPKTALPATRLDRPKATSATP